MLHRLDVDWESQGYDDEALDEPAELGLRTFHSMLVDPGQPPRDGIALRGLLARWLGAAIVYPKLAQAMDALRPARKPGRRHSAAS